MEAGASAALGAGLIGSLALGFALVAFFAACAWKIFTKAGKPGWAAIVPIYNVIVLHEICERPAWWIVLWILPLVSIVPALVLPFDLARVFGKSPAYGAGLLFLGVIFYPMVAFGSAEYVGQGAAQPKSDAGNAPAAAA